MGFGGTCPRDCEGRMSEANERCYAVVRRELRTLFGALCANKSADLVFAGDKVRCTLQQRRELVESHRERIWILG